MSTNTDNRSDAEWLEEMFEYELCHECGGDAPNHIVGPDPLGLRHAYCLSAPIVDDLGAVVADLEANANRTPPLECGHYATTNRGVGTGWGAKATGERYCWNCCAKDDLDQLEAAEVGADLSAYVSQGGGFVTGWPGGNLMRIVSWGCTHNFSRHRRHLRAVDHLGRVWSGTGAEGEYCHLRLTRRMDYRKVERHVLVEWIDQKFPLVSA